MSDYNYRAYFHVTQFTKITDTYLDEEYFLDMTHENMEESENSAFALFIKAFMLDADPFPVVSKIVLLRIVAHKSSEVKRFLPPGAVDEFEQTRTCRVCGCTDEDCSQCIAKTGGPCHWIEIDLCSACKGFDTMSS